MSGALFLSCAREDTAAAQRISEALRRRPSKVSDDLRCCVYERLDLSTDAGRRMALKFHQIIRILEIEPVPWRHAKVKSETEGGVGGDGYLSLDQSAETRFRNAGRLGQAILGDAHRLEKILREYLTGMWIGNERIFHGQ